MVSLGLDLWNFSYDEIHHMELPQYPVGYADDIAAVIVALDIVDAQRRTKAWMGYHGLGLAAEKTERVTRQTIPTEVDMRVETDAIATTNAVKYLTGC